MIHSQMTGNFVAITTVLSPWGFRLKKLFKNYTKKMDEAMLYKKITLKMMWLLHIKHCKSVVKILLQYMCLKCFPPCIFHRFLSDKALPHDNVEKSVLNLSVRRCILSGYARNHFNHSWNRNPQNLTWVWPDTPRWQRHMWVSEFAFCLQLLQRCTIDCRSSALTHSPFSFD